MYRRFSMVFLNYNGPASVHWKPTGAKEKSSSFFQEFLGQRLNPARGLTQSHYSIDVEWMVEGSAGRRLDHSWPSGVSWWSAKASGQGPLSYKVTCAVLISGNALTYFSTYWTLTHHPTPRGRPYSSVKQSQPSHSPHWNLLYFRFLKGFIYTHVYIHILILRPYHTLKSSSLCCWNTYISLTISR